MAHRPDSPVRSAHGCDESPWQAEGRILHPSGVQGLPCQSVRSGGVCLVRPSRRRLRQESSHIVRSVFGVRQTVGTVNLSYPARPQQPGSGLIAKQPSSPCLIRYPRQSSFVSLSRRWAGSAWRDWSCRTRSETWQRYSVSCRGVAGYPESACVRQNQPARAPSVAIRNAKHFLPSNALPVAAAERPD